jgi:hypothetical protein
MTDREKTIKELEKALSNMDERITPEDVDKLICTAQDALSLLKAQEPIEPIKHLSTGQICGSCKKVLLRKYKYCPSCGKAVKWDEPTKEE